MEPRITIDAHIFWNDEFRMLNDELNSSVHHSSFDDGGCEGVRGIRSEPHQV
jgi:hypothetical protein